MELLGEEVKLNYLQPNVFSIFSKKYRVLILGKIKFITIY